MVRSVDMYGYPSYAETRLGLAEYLLVFFLPLMFINTILL
jgi:hypothetical protein